MCCVLDRIYYFRFWITTDAFSTSMSIGQTPATSEDRNPESPTQATGANELQCLVADIDNNVMSLDLETTAPSIHYTPKNLRTITHKFVTPGTPQERNYAKSDCNEKSTPISVDGLADRMRKPNPFLLLDCRPFTSYNNHHVTGALNMTCSDRFSRRRLDRGKCRVADLICGAECKTLFTELLSSDVILYSEESSTDLPQSSPIMSVSTSLSREGRTHSILTGLLPFVPFYLSIIIFNLSNVPQC